MEPIIVEPPMSRVGIVEPPARLFRIVEPVSGARSVLLRSSVIVEPIIVEPPEIDVRRPFLWVISASFKEG